MQAQSTQRKHDAAFVQAIAPRPSMGNGTEAQALQKRISSLDYISPSYDGETPSDGATLETQLYDSLAKFKIYTSQIAMHLDDDWRQRLFKQLDSLLDIGEWDKGDLAPRIESFASFLRLLLIIRPQVRPGIGATSAGNLVAAWTTGSDRLTIEALPRDLIRWSVSVSLDGEKERAAGVSTIQRLDAVLQPYGPARWFKHG